LFGLTTVRFDVTRPQGAAKDSAVAQLIELWGDEMIVRGERYRFADCEILAAGRLGLAAVSYRDTPVAELVALNAWTPGAGAGTALLEAAVTLCRSTCHTLRTVTTNDNLSALRFYQRRGFVLSALRVDAMKSARDVKPNIPLIGHDGIPIRDELELVMKLIT
jgi:GNAT superfamily N-acetyltransferase